jgi:hypothetical protein
MSVHEVCTSTVPVYRKYVRRTYDGKTPPAVKQDFIHYGAYGKTPPKPLMIKFNKEHTETPSHWRGGECEEKNKIFVVESYSTGSQLLKVVGNEK